MKKRQRLKSNADRIVQAKKIDLQASAEALGTDEELARAAWARADAWARSKRGTRYGGGDDAEDDGAV